MAGVQCCREFFGKEPEGGEVLVGTVPESQEWTCALISEVRLSSEL